MVQWDQMRRPPFRPSKMVSRFQSFTCCHQTLYMFYYCIPCVCVLYAQGYSMCLCSVCPRLFHGENIDHTLAIHTMTPVAHPNNVLTFCAVPSAPTVMNITVLSPTEIQVDWVPPAHENGDITHYNVYISYGSKAVSYNTTRTSLNVTNLPSSVSITVRVSASTRVGEGQLSHPINVTTLETGS